MLEEWRVKGDMIECFKTLQGFEISRNKKSFGQ